MQNFHQNFMTFFEFESLLHSKSLKPLDAKFAIICLRSLKPKPLEKLMWDSVLIFKTLGKNESGSQWVRDVRMMTIMTPKCWWSVHFREKERLFRAHMQSAQNCNSDEGNNTWEAVAALIGLDLEDQVVVSNSSSSKKLQDMKIAELLNSKLGTDPNSPIGIIMAARDLDGRRLKDPPPTPSKATDLSRFKEVNSRFSFFFPL